MINMEQILHGKTHCSTLNERDMALVTLELVLINHRTLNQIQEGIKLMATDQQALDTVLSDLQASAAARDAATTKAFADNKQAIADLAAKLAAGTVVTPADFSVEIAKLLTLHDSNVAAVAEAKAAEPVPPVVVAPVPVAAVEPAPVVVDPAPVPVVPPVATADPVPAAAV